MDQLLNDHVEWQVGIKHPAREMGKEITLEKMIHLIKAKEPIEKVFNYTYIVHNINCADIKTKIFSFSHQYKVQSAHIYTTNIMTTTSGIYFN